MEWSEGDLVWFETNIGHPLPGEIQEVHRAAQVIIVQALINGKVSIFQIFFLLFDDNKCSSFRSLEGLSHKNKIILEFRGIETGLP